MRKIFIERFASFIISLRRRVAPTTRLGLISDRVSDDAIVKSSHYVAAGSNYATNHAPSASRHVTYVLATQYTWAALFGLARLRPLRRRRTERRARTIDTSRTRNRIIRIRLPVQFGCQSRSLPLAASSMLVRTPRVSLAWVAIVD